MMSMDMNMDRIRRLKCQFCGSKLKRKLDAVTGNDKVVGYSLMCCNCGHIDNFALSSSVIPMYLCGQRGEVEKINIKCPFFEDGYSVDKKDLLTDCKNISCPYRPSFEKEDTSSDLVAAATDTSMTIERKYQ